jgi:hypothetical protein
VLLTSLWSSPVPQTSSLSSIPRPQGSSSNNHEYTCLTLECEKTYNIPDAEVAQVVEQRTENPRVSGSTPLLGTNHEVAERNQVSNRMPPCKGEVIENV